MPILRTEVARVEVTPDGVLLVDRMNKRFVRATKDELKGMLPKNAEFSRLEKILLDASLPGGKTELSGKDIGIPSLEKAKVQLYEFSTKEFSMTPTELTSKYRQVPLEELVKMLVAEILGRENKHQFFFNRLVLIQVLDRSLILFLLILQILLQTVQLTLQGSQFTFYRRLKSNFMSSRQKNFQ